jgi:hypothetical protein
MMRLQLRTLVFALAAAPVAMPAFAGQAPAPAATSAGLAQRFAPVDLTGTWVSVITEDWQVRMLSPPKGDFESLPLTRAARDAANQMDMAQVAAAGRSCEAYGAPIVMREPGRVRISWQDAATLRLETDAGQQTRLFHFDRPASTGGAASLQGDSLAEWQYARGFDPVKVAAAPVKPGTAAPQPSGGRLKVVTSNLAPGFLRKNGVPYSAATIVTEYYNLLVEPSGQPWFVVTTVVHDPANLAVDYITSTNFRKEGDNAKFKPRPCTL